MKEELLKLAKAVVEEYVLYGKVPVVRAGYVICDEEHFRGQKLSCNVLEKKCGCYVAIFKNGNLRGCMGNLTATEENLGAETVKASISACCQDVRFAEISPDELPLLSYRIYVTGSCERLSSDILKKHAGNSLEKSSEIQHDVPDVKKYGLVLSTEYRKGIVLPDEPGIDCFEKQIQAACERGSISIDENPAAYSFPAEIFE